LAARHRPYGFVVDAQLDVAASTVALGPDAPDYSGLLEDLQMVRQQVGAKAEFGGELTRGDVTEDEPVDEGEAHGLPKSGEDRRSPPQLFIHDLPP
jgi:hypothetical protein